MFVEWTFKHTPTKLNFKLEDETNNILLPFGTISEGWVGKRCNAILTYLLNNLRTDSMEQNPS